MMPPNAMANQVQYELNNVDNIHNTRFYRDCYEIAEYIVIKSTSRNQRQNKIGEKLHQLCSEMKIKYEPVFSNLGDRLELNRDNLYEKSRDVMREAFSDNECNFGRIVSIHAFCLSICEYCYNDPLLRDSMNLVLQATAEVMYSNKEWFERNNSWTGFVDFFTNPADKLWKGFFITTVSLGALAGMIYANS